MKYDGAFLPVEFLLSDYFILCYVNKNTNKTHDLLNYYLITNKLLLNYILSFIAYPHDLW